MRAIIKPLYRSFIATRYRNAVGMLSRCDVISRVDNKHLAGDKRKFNSIQILQVLRNSGRP